jgi:hypothetical protein
MAVESSCPSPHKSQVAAAGYLQTARSLAAYRILFGVGILFVFVPGRQVIGGVSGEVGDVPDDFYHPPLGPFSLLSGWPPHGVLLGLEIGMTAALVMITVGAFTRSACLVYAATGTALAGFAYSTGKVDHTILWTLVIPVAMAFTPWGDHLSLDSCRTRIQRRRRPAYGADVLLPIQIVAVALSLMFAAAGVVKVLSGWLAFGDSAVLGWTVRHQFETGAAPDSPAITQAPIAFWYLLDHITVLFEVGFLIAVVRRQWFVRYLLVAVAFHLGASLIGLPGFNPIAVVYLLFIRLDRIAEVFAQLLEVARKNLLAVVGVAVLAAFAYVAIGVTAGRPVTLQEVMEHAGLPSSVILWTLILGVAVVAALRRREGQRRARFDAPAWLLSVAMAILFVQTALTLLVSEPYPSLAGPLFMGSVDTGQHLVVNEQRFLIVEGDAELRVPHSVVLPLSDSGAALLGKVRFPAPPSGADLQSRLADLGHTFSSRHLRGYGGELSTREAAWIRRSLASEGVGCGDACVLRVEWYELTFGRSGREALSEQLVSSRDYTL